MLGYEFKGRMPGRRLNTASISHHAEIQLLVPRTRLLFCPCGKHALHSPMQILDLSISFGMVSCGSCLIDSQQHTRFLEHCGLKISSLIWVHAVWNSEPTDPVLNENFNTGRSPLIWDRIYLRPFSKATMHSQDETAPLCLCAASAWGI